MQSGEDRSTPDTTTFLLHQRKLVEDPAAAPETWLTGMGLADQEGESAAPLGAGTPAVHALEAYYAFQAHTTTEHYTLDTAFLGTFKVRPCLEVLGTC